jgi:putative membrane protein
MKKVKEIVLNFIRGFFMALADSVPGVSGGTVAFILGFYDKFINSIDDLIRGNLKAKKEAVIFLLKIGVGWIVGMAMAALILTSLLKNYPYQVSSVFLGFVVFAIPFLIKEEKIKIKDKKDYKNLVFAIIGLIIVISITILNAHVGLEQNIENMSVSLAVQLFVAGAIAITAMILPGISGSTILLIFGVYNSIMAGIKALLTLNFATLPALIIFGFGVLTGIIVFVRLIKIALEKYRNQTIFMVLGMMIGSLFSIISNAGEISGFIHLTTLIFFIIGGAIILLLQQVKKWFEK